MKKLDTFDDITLLLLFVKSFKYKVTPKVSVIRSWKNFDFDALDRLAEKGYIYAPHKSKSVMITEKGAERA